MTADLLSDVRSYLHEHEDRLLNDWLELVRRPSVSATGQGIELCCDFLREKMEELDIAAVKYPLLPHPLLLGRYGSCPDKRTVLIYAHYDVKPPGDLSQWLSDPFVPRIHEQKVYARGSADNKAPLMAHLKALEYYRARGIDVPVNLIFLFEGCEEEGSRGLPEFLREHRDELKADLVFFSDGPRDPCGLPVIALGAKGDLSVRLTVRTMNRNVHSRYAPVLPSAAWQLVELLHSLKQGDRVLVPGFYDDMLPYSDRELAAMKELPASEDRLNTMYEARSAGYGPDFYPRLLGMPSLNICSISTGADGVVPAQAEALLDIRLVPGQSPEKVFRKLQSYVLALGCDNVKLTMESALPPSKTPMCTPWLPAVEEACSRIYGQYVIYPCRPSSAPDYLWTDILQLPAIQVRWSDADSDNHGPNEHLSIREYFDGIALTACTLQAVADTL